MIKMKKVNNINDVSTTNLNKMLKMERFKNAESQKMIKDEIKFRNKNESEND